jgi:hypothetical protein
MAYDTDEASFAVVCAASSEARRFGGLHTGGALPSSPPSVNATA